MLALQQQPAMVVLRAISSVGPILVLSVTLVVSLVALLLLVIHVNKENSKILPRIFANLVKLAAMNAQVQQSVIIAMMDMVIFLQPQLA